MEKYYILGAQLAGIALVTGILIFLVKRIEKNKRTRQVGFVLRLSLVVGALLMGLQTIGVSLSAVMAFGGIGGLAVGFAAKDMIANFFGGFQILFDRPFTEGDWIRSPDREIEGIVEHIGWRVTRIRTLDKRPLYVQNALFTSITIENPSRMSHRKFKETIGVRYDDFSRIEPILKEIREMFHAHPDVDQKQAILVHLTEFGSSSLDILVSAHIKPTQQAPFFAAKEDILMKIHTIVTTNGAEFAFPTTTLIHAAPIPVEQ